ncbi:hypothetical protein BESB_018190 [Besnoitia besnoiti]|uniref:DUF1764 domain-containing protein n=1 Tax=Besnoitia besnoiti TaxID=94643 RepID=A0A2A9M883_BESBE|nr:hypothetical protein BESB_018190 [Besnoitia besnoiti]PFH32501.1 hypothetical protein BESB_018190 [Besnoitia besnoiti]
MEGGGSSPGGGREACKRRRHRGGDSSAAKKKRRAAVPGDARAASPRSQAPSAFPVSALSKDREEQRKARALSVPRASSSATAWSKPCASSVCRPWAAVRKAHALPAHVGRPPAFGAGEAERKKKKKRRQETKEEEPVAEASGGCPQDSRKEIDDLFADLMGGGKKGKETAKDGAKGKMAEGAKKKGKKKRRPQTFDEDMRLNQPAVRRTADGLRIYTEEELGIGKGGDTPECPFDCSCCF